MLPGEGNDIMRLVNWAEPHGLPLETVGEVANNGAFVHTNFGLTRESFWAENQRVLAVLNGPGQ